MSPRGYHATMTNSPNSRPARPDEREPSDDMRAADVANGEPEATDPKPPDSAPLVTDDPQPAPDAPPPPDDPDDDDATLVTDDPGE